MAHSMPRPAVTSTDLLRKHHAVIAGVPQPGVQGVQLRGGDLHGPSSVLQHGKARRHPHRAPPLLLLLLLLLAATLRAELAALAQRAEAFSLKLRRFPLLLQKLTRVLLPAAAVPRAPGTGAPAAAGAAAQLEIKALPCCVADLHVGQAVLLARQPRQLVHLQGRHRRVQNRAASLGVDARACILRMPTRLPFFPP